MLDVTDFA